MTEPSLSAIIVFTSLALLFIGGCGQSVSTAPVATRRPHPMTIHGDTRQDDYYWLNDKEDPEVIRYLEAENAYTQSAMRHTSNLQETLYNEFRERLKETDLSVPVRDGDYYYYSRTFEGKQYPVNCRKQGQEGEEEILLDRNELAKAHKYFRIGAFEVSPDHRLLAYSIDTSGAETYTIRIKDLASGKMLPDEIPNTYYSVEWAADNRTLFYNVLDDAKRPYKLFRHRLGSSPDQDELVYHEEDESYFLSLSKTRSRRYLLLELESSITSEVHVLDSDDPGGAFRVVHPRQHAMEYGLDHHENDFYITTNDGAVNFKLMRTPVTALGKSNWSEVIPHRPSIKLDGVDCFKDHLVVYTREAGLKKMEVRRFSDGTAHTIQYDEPVYTTYAGDNREFDTSILRFSYMSLVTPRSVYDYDMNARSRELLKQDEVLGGYDPSNYESRRVTAEAPDGKSVPISLVMRKGTPLDGTAPLLLYGYGSYGASMDPTFSANRVSLLDRGMIFAIAHIRGGGDMGRPWYEDGKFLHKRNTFTDFIACGEHLVDSKYTSSDRLAIMGGSAGGLLMGAVTNMRPDLFKAVVAQVPFVDVVTTMLDPSIPLTVIEYEEWGNPNDKIYYDYMKSYSPVDNVEAKAYPEMLITAGLNDPRVGYWEPAKWTAKLRSLKTDDNRLLLKTNMGAGHGGKSGRYDKLREVAFEYAFVLDSVGWQP